MAAPDAASRAPPPAPQEAGEADAGSVPGRATAGGAISSSPSRDKEAGSSAVEASTAASAAPPASSSAAMAAAATGGGAVAASPPGAGAEATATGSHIVPSADGASRGTSAASASPKRAKDAPPRRKRPVPPPRRQRGHSKAMSTGSSFRTPRDAGSGGGRGGRASITGAVTGRGGGRPSVASLDLAETPAQRAQHFLLRCSREGLTESMKRELRDFMVNNPPEFVRERVVAMLDHLADRERSNRHGQHMSPSMYKAHSFLKKSKARMQVAMGAKEAYLAGSDEYRDVRLSDYVVHFGPEHAAAAAKSPGEVAVGSVEVWDGSTSPSGVSGGAGGSDAAGGESERPKGTFANGRGPPRSAPLRETLKARILVTNERRWDAQVMFRSLVPHPEMSAMMLVEPQSLIVRKGHPEWVTLVLHLYMPDKDVVSLVACEVTGGATTYIAALAHSDPGVFGVPLSEVEFCDDDGLHVPCVLPTLAGYLYDHGGLESPGIFRIQPDHDEMFRIKAELGRGTFKTCKDINCVAHLIKVWYRELATPILATIPNEVMMSVNDEASAIRVARMLKSREQHLLKWIVRLLVRVADNEDKNKMNVKNCAIVVGPNLFNVHEKANPMEALMMSQHVVGFLHRLLVAEQAGRFAKNSFDARGGDDVVAAVDAAGSAARAAPARAGIPTMGVSRSALGSPGARSSAAAAAPVPSPPPPRSPKTSGGDA